MEKELSTSATIPSSKAPSTVRLKQLRDISRPKKARFLILLKIKISVYSISDMLDLIIKIEM